MREQVHHRSGARFTVGGLKMDFTGATLIRKMVYGEGCFGSLFLEPCFWEPCFWDSQWPGGGGGRGGPGIYQSRPPRQPHQTGHNLVVANH